MAVFALSVGISGLCLAQSGAWRVIDRERGITITARDEPGRELPTFRGQGNIRGDVLSVLAVVADAEGAAQWAKGADRVQLVRALGPRTHLIYTYTDTPWPVSDRDMIMKRTIEVAKPGQEFWVRLVCAPKVRKPVDGVIRVTDCVSHFHLKRVDDKTTYVEYQVNLDPGGRLPDWLIRWASKKIPFETLVDLEKQVGRSKGKYEAFVREWANAS
jgi:hypothetical protein